jgi:hypothetical protein
VHPSTIQTLYSRKLGIGASKAVFTGFACFFLTGEAEAQLKIYYGCHLPYNRKIDTRKEKKKKQGFRRQRNKVSPASPIASSFCPGKI